MTAPSELRVEGLFIEDAASGLSIVADVSLTVTPGRTLGIVGQSGSGKSTICKAILGILPRNLRVSGGRMTFGGIDLLSLDFASWQRLRGPRIGAVFQDPASYLNPSITVGRQLAELLRVHLGMPREAARHAAYRLFSDIGLRHPERVYGQYPFELSGGMLQRIGIAMAVTVRPELLIADEPTTALDVTVQADILDLLAALRTRSGLGMLFVSHDLAVVAQVSDDVLVMENGRIVEAGTAEQVLSRPRHPYTRSLVDGHERYSIDRILAPEQSGG